eukprot:1245185-Rhodomonas_salina.1
MLPQNATLHIALFAMLHPRRAVAVSTEHRHVRPQTWRASVRMEHCIARAPHAMSAPDIAQRYPFWYQTSHDATARCNISTRHRISRAKAGSTKHYEIRECAASVPDIA